MFWEVVQYLLKQKSVENHNYLLAHWGLSDSALYKSTIDVDIDVAVYLFG